MKINPVLGNSQPLRNNDKQQAVSFKAAIAVKVPPEYVDRAKSLVKTFKYAIEDCDTGLFQMTNRKAARDKVPVEIVKAAVEQAQSGKQLLFYA